MKINNCITNHLNVTDYLHVSIDQNNVYYVSGIESSSKRLVGVTVRKRGLCQKGSQVF